MEHMFMTLQDFKRLHCIKRDSIGGENQLVDGLAIAEKMRHEHPEAFNILCNVNIPGRYIKTDKYLEAHRPLFRVNDNGDRYSSKF